MMPSYGVGKTQGSSVQSICCGNGLKTVSSVCLFVCLFGRLTRDSSRSLFMLLVTYHSTEV